MNHQELQNVILDQTLSKDNDERKKSNTTCSVIDKNSGASFGCSEFFDQNLDSTVSKKVTLVQDFNMTGDRWNNAKENELEKVCNEAEIRDQSPNRAVSLSPKLDESCTKIKLLDFSVKINRNPVLEKYVSESMVKKRIKEEPNVTPEKHCTTSSIFLSQCEQDEIVKNELNTSKLLEETLYYGDNCLTLQRTDDFGQIIVKEEPLDNLTTPVPTIVYSDEIDFEGFEHISKEQIAEIKRKSLLLHSNTKYRNLFDSEETNSSVTKPVNNASLKASCMKFRSYMDNASKDLSSSIRNPSKEKRLRGRPRKKTGTKGKPCRMGRPPKKNSGRLGRPPKQLPRKSTESLRLTSRFENQSETPPKKVSPLRNVRSPRMMSSEASKSLVLSVDENTKKKPEPVSEYGSSSKLHQNNNTPLFKEPTFSEHDDMTILKENIEDNTNNIVKSKKKYSEDAYLRKHLRRKNFQNCEEIPSDNSDYLKQVSISKKTNVVHNLSKRIDCPANDMKSDSVSFCKVSKNYHLNNRTKKLLQVEPSVSFMRLFNQPKNGNVIASNKHLTMKLVGKTSANDIVNSKNINRTTNQHGIHFNENISIIPVSNAKRNSSLLYSNGNISIKPVSPYKNKEKITINSLKSKPSSKYGTTLMTGGGASMSIANRGITKVNCQNRSDSDMEFSYFSGFKNNARRSRSCSSSSSRSTGLPPTPKDSPHQENKLDASLEQRKSPNISKFRNVRENDIILKCKICPLTTYDLKLFVDHFDIHDHWDLGIAACPMCSRVFREFDKPYLTDHLGRCIKIFKGLEKKDDSLASLINYNRIKNCDKNNFGCTVCFVKFSDENELKEHKMTHSEILKCHLCKPSTFYTADDLKTHILSHFGKFDQSQSSEICNLEEKNSDRNKDNPNGVIPSKGSNDLRKSKSPSNKLLISKNMQSKSVSNSYLSNMKTPEKKISNINKFLDQTTQDTREESENIEEEPIARQLNLNENNTSAGKNQIIDSFQDDDSESCNDLPLMNSLTVYDQQIEENRGNEIVENKRSQDGKSGNNEVKGNGDKKKETVINLAEVKKSKLRRSRQLINETIDRVLRLKKSLSSTSNGDEINKRTKSKSRMFRKELSVNNEQNYDSMTINNSFFEGRPRRKRKLSLKMTEMEPKKRKSPNKGTNGSEIRLSEVRKLKPTQTIRNKEIEKTDSFVSVVSTVSKVNLTKASNAVMQTTENSKNIKAVSIIENKQDTLLSLDVNVDEGTENNSDLNLREHRLNDVNELINNVPATHLQPELFDSDLNSIEMNELADPKIKLSQGCNDSIANENSTNEMEVTTVTNNDINDREKVFPNESPKISSPTSELLSQFDVDDILRDNNLCNVDDLLSNCEQPMETKDNNINDEDHLFTEGEEKLLTSLWADFESLLNYVRSSSSATQDDNDKKKTEEEESTEQPVTLDENEDLKSISMNNRTSENDNTPKMPLGVVLVDETNKLSITTLESGQRVGVVFEEPNEIESLVNKKTSPTKILKTKTIDKEIKDQISGIILKKIDSPLKKKQLLTDPSNNTKDDLLDLNEVNNIELSNFDVEINPLDKKVEKEEASISSSMPSVKVWEVMKNNWASKLEKLITKAQAKDFNLKKNKEVDLLKQLGYQMNTVHENDDDALAKIEANFKILAAKKEQDE